MISLLLNVFFAWAPWVAAGKGKGMSMGSSTPRPTPAPATTLEECESGCFPNMFTGVSTGVCESNLVCFPIGLNDGGDIPGCGPPGEGEISVCIDIDNIPNDGLFFLSPFNGELQRCQGGCLLGDFVCDSHLECWENTSLDVPGCSGTNRGFGYCYDPADVATEPPTSPPTDSPAREDLPLDRVANLGEPRDAFPLSRCQGSCKSFSDCEGDLICFERGCENPTNDVPGCIGHPGSKYTDFCISTLDIPENTLIFLGRPGHPQSVYPLGKCQGHCDFDRDCAGTLSCFQRTYGQDVTIPGCSGTLAEDATNYCYDVSDA